MKIGPVTIQKMQTEVSGLLEAYAKEIDEAYIKAKDEPLNVSLKVNLSPSDGTIKLKTSIDFVAEKIKDSVTSYADESQQELFEGD